MVPLLVYFFPPHPLLQSQPNPNNTLKLKHVLGAVAQLLERGPAGVVDEGRGPTHDHERAGPRRGQVGRYHLVGDVAQPKRPRPLLLLLLLLRCLQRRQPVHRVPRAEARLLGPFLLGAGGLLRGEVVELGPEEDVVGGPVFTYLDGGMNRFVKREAANQPNQSINQPVLVGEEEAAARAVLRVAEDGLDELEHGRDACSSNSCMYVGVSHSPMVMDGASQSVLRGNHIYEPKPFSHQKRTRPARQHPQVRDAVREGLGPNLHQPPAPVLEAADGALHVHGGPQREAVEEEAHLPALGVLGVLVRGVDLCVCV